MTQLVIKRRSVWHSWLGITGITVLSMLLAWGIFEFGRYRAGYDRLEAAAALAAVNGQIAELERQHGALREQSAVLERSGQIERQAYKQLEGAVTGLQDEILELKAELAFYRGIVSPDDASTGLSLQGFELSAGSQLRQYRYKVVLTQVLNNGTVARGDLRFEVEGTLQGEAKSYPLEQLSVSQEKTPLAFKFKYFQIIDGDFMLPDGFEPIKVTLTVIPKSSTHKKLTQAFDWVVKEKN
jgi:hypothetical protein